MTNRVTIGISDDILKGLVSYAGERGYMIENPHFKIDKNNQILVIADFPEGELRNGDLQEIMQNYFYEKR